MSIHLFRKLRKLRKCGKRRRNKSGPARLIFDTFFPVGILTITTIVILQIVSEDTYPSRSAAPGLGAALPPAEIASSDEIDPVIQQELRSSALRQVDSGIDFRIRNGWCSSVENVLLKNEVFGTIGKFGDAVDFKTRSIDRSYERKTLDERLPAIVSEVHFTCIKDRQASRQYVVNFVLTALDDDVERCNTSQPERSNLKAYLNFCQFIALN